MISCPHFHSSQQFECNSVYVISIWYHLPNTSFVKISTVKVIPYFRVYMAVYQYFLSNVDNIWYRRSQQNYIEWFWVFLWKSAHWKPYLTSGCIWLPVCTFAHLLPHWLKFVIWGLNVMLLSMCDYHENWCRHTGHYFCSYTLTPFYVKKIQIALVKYIVICHKVHCFQSCLVTLQMYCGSYKWFSSQIIDQCLATAIV